MNDRSLDRGIDYIRESNVSKDRERMVEDVRRWQKIDAREDVCHIIDVGRLALFEGQDFRADGLRRDMICQRIGIRGGSL